MNAVFTNPLGIKSKKKIYVAAPILTVPYLTTDHANERMRYHELHGYKIDKYGIKADSEDYLKAIYKLVRLEGGNAYYERIS